MRMLNVSYSPHHRILCLLAVSLLLSLFQGAPLQVVSLLCTKHKCTKHKKLQAVHDIHLKWIILDYNVTQDLHNEILTIFTKKLCTSVMNKSECKLYLLVYIILI